MTQESPLFLLFEQDSVIVETKENINIQNIKIFGTKENLFYLQGESFLIPLTKNTIALKLTDISYTFVHHETFTTLKFVKQDLSVFSAIIDQLCVVRQPAKEPGYGTMITEKVVKGLEATSTFVSSGLRQSSDVVSYGVVKTGEIIKNRIKVQEDYIVPGPIKTTVEFTESCVRATSEVSGAVIGAVVDGITYVTAGTMIAVHDSIPKSSSDPHFDNVVKICLQGTKGMVEVIGSAKEGIKKVITTSTETTSNVLDHKYGNDVKEISISGFNIVKGGVETVMNVGAMSVKAIAIGTVTKTTGSVVGHLIKKSEESKKVDGGVEPIQTEVTEKPLNEQENVTENVELPPLPLVKEIDTQTFDPLDSTIEIEWVKIDEDLCE